MANPRIASVTPNPVTVGQTLTVSGTVPSLAAAGAAAAGGSGALNVRPVLAGAGAAAAGGSGVLDVSGAYTPQIVSVTPNPVTAGQSLTITGTTGRANQVALGSTGAASASGAGDVSVAQRLASTGAAAAGGSGTLQLRTAAPVINSVSPNPVNAGSTLIVTGAVAVTSLEAAGAAAAGGSGALRVVVPLAAVGLAAASGTGVLARPLTIPRQLVASDQESGTGSESGTHELLDPGEWVEFRVDAGAGGRFTFLATLAASRWGLAEFLVDGAPVATWPFLGDFDEEEDDPMPSSTLTTGVDVTLLASGGVWTRLDTTQRSGRTRVVITNKAGTDLLGLRFVQGTSTPAPSDLADVLVEANYGRFEAPITEAISVWGKPVLQMGATGSPSDGLARLVQFGA